MARISVGREEATGVGQYAQSGGKSMFSGSQMDRDGAQQVTLLSPSLQSRTEVARLGPCNSLPLVFAPGCRNWLGQLSCDLSWCLYPQCPPASSEKS